MELAEGNFKKSEVGLIPYDWNIQKLSAISVEIGDGIHTTPSYVNDSEFHFINGNNLDNGSIKCYDETKCVSKEEYELLKKNLNHSTILMSINGTIGNLAFFNNEKVVLGKSAAYVNLKDKVDKKFIYFLLQHSSIKNYYENELTGTTIRNLSLKSIRDTPIPLPRSKDEQTTIATALSDVDSLIENLEKLVAKKCNIKQGMMQELLKSKEGWSTKKLGDFLMYEQPTKYLVKDTEYNNNNQTPVLTAGKTFILGYTDEEFGIYDNIPVIIFDDFTTANKFVTFTFKAKSSAMKMLTGKNKEVNLRFMYEIMQTIHYPLSDHKRYWISEYQHIEIKVPSPEEQKSISEILSNMDSEIEQLEIKLHKYRMIKQGMMQVLLIGKIRLV